MNKRGPGKVSCKMKEGTSQEPGWERTFQAEGTACAKTLVKEGVGKAWRSHRACPLTLAAGGEQVRRGGCRRGTPVQASVQH